MYKLRLKHALDVKRKFPYLSLMVFITVFPQVYVSFFNVAFNSKYIVVPDDFGSIQDAINSALEGSTIIVHGGTYFENLLIDKPLSIVGFGATIVGAGHSNVVKICANDVNFSGFKIIGTCEFPWSGIYVCYSSNCLLSNNIVLGNYFGIYIYDSSCITLSNNTLLRNKFGLRVWGLTLSHFMHNIDGSNSINGKRVYYLVNAKDETIDSLDVGYIGVVNSSGILLRNISISGNGEGVLLAYSKDCVLDGVTLSFNVRGARIVACDKITIYNSSINNNDCVGLAVDSSSQVIIRNNLVSNNFYGVVISSSSLLAKRSVRNVVSGNFLLRNHVGVQLFECSLGFVEANYIKFNHIGLSMDSSCDNNVLRNTFMENNLALGMVSCKRNALYFNSFIDNEDNVKVSSSYGNVWNLGYPMGGNYWSDFTLPDVYSGRDQDVKGSDGLTDYSYVIDGYNIDKYPQRFPVKSFTIEPVKGLSLIVDSFSDARTWGNFRWDYVSKCLLFEEPDPAGISFFKVVIPRNVLYCNTSWDWHISIDGSHVDANIHVTENVTCIIISNLSAFDKIFSIRLTGSLMFKSPVYCDVNGDGLVNLIDIASACKSFGSSVGHSRWNPFADVNSDGVVDLVDLCRIVVAALTSNP